MVFGKGYPYDGAEKYFRRESFSRIPVYRYSIPRNGSFSKFLMGRWVIHRENVSNMGKNGIFFLFLIDEDGRIG